jgi:ribosomal protein S18 acetylase RimI-like enzyme
MSIRIREIEQVDLPAVIGLMSDFARYEQLEEHLEVTEERMAAAMFGENAFVQGLIAIQDKTPVGYAIFYPNFLTFRGQRGFFLEDLYVSGITRGAGIGRQMLVRIAKMAADRGFERIDFLVLDWNESAIGFYRKLGAEKAEGEGHFKFTDDAFRELAS